VCFLFWATQLNDLARTYTLLVGMPEHTGEPLADAQADMVTAFQKAVAEVGCALVRTLDAGQPEGGESKDEEKGPRAWQQFCVATYLRSNNLRTAVRTEPYVCEA
jgi:hypothetical protein